MVFTFEDDVFGVDRRGLCRR